MMGASNENFDWWQVFGGFLSMLATVAAGWWGFKQGKKKNDAEVRKMDKESISIDAQLTNYKDEQISKLLKELDVTQQQNEVYKKQIHVLEEQIQTLKILNTMYKTTKKLL